MARYITFHIDGFNMSEKKVSDIISHIVTDIAEIKYDT